MGGRLFPTALDSSLKADRAYPFFFYLNNTVQSLDSESEKDIRSWGVYPNWTYKPEIVRLLQLAEWPARVRLAS